MDGNLLSAWVMLDEQHNIIWRYSFGGRTFGGYHSDSGDQRIVTCIGSGTCPDCGRAAFIRHTIALKPYTQDVQFVLENVPVPTE